MCDMYASCYCMQFPIWNQQLLRIGFHSQPSLSLMSFPMDTTVSVQGQDIGKNISREQSIMHLRFGVPLDLTGVAEPSVVAAAISIQVQEPRVHSAWDQKPQRSQGTK